MAASRVDLKSYNTLQLPAYAEHVLRWQTLEQLQQLRKDWLAEFPQVLVLGGGSNLVLTKDIEVPCVLSQAKRISVVESNNDSVVIDVDAGYGWHDLVGYCLEQGWFGIENLVLIPGSVGAAPVQNIGAYGRQISDVCVQVQTFDWLSGELKNHAEKDCRFTYRNSIFKPINNQLNTRTIITRLRLCLHKQAIVYINDKLATELCQLLNMERLQQPEPTSLADMITQLRRKKLPDPEVIANAGSFFQNPIISFDRYQSTPSLHGIAPHRLENGQVKISAAALIEAKNWKGHTTPSGAGVSAQHALCLVNRGTARGADIIALAQQIQRDVFASYDIQLKIEPAIYR